MQFEQWFDTSNPYLWYIAVYALIMFYVIIQWLRQRGRIKVRVKTPLKEYEVWKKPEADGKTIVMSKAKGKNNPGWKFEFSNQSLLPKRAWGRSFYAVDIFPDADKAMDYKYDISEADQPKWTKKESKKFIEAEVMHKLGEAEKGPPTSLLWIILVGVIILGVLQILAMRGIKIV